MATRACGFPRRPAGRGGSTLEPTAGLCSSRVSRRRDHYTLCRPIGQHPPPTAASARRRGDARGAGTRRDGLGQREPPRFSAGNSAPATPSQTTVGENSGGARPRAWRRRAGGRPAGASPTGRERNELADSQPAGWKTRLGRWPKGRVEQRGVPLRQSGAATFTLNRTFSSMRVPELARADI